MKTKNNTNYLVLFLTSFDIEYYDSKTGDSGLLDPDFINSEHSIFKNKTLVFLNNDQLRLFKKTLKLKKLINDTIVLYNRIGLHYYDLQKETFESLLTLIRTTFSIPKNKNCDLMWKLFQLINFGYGIFLRERQSLYLVDKNILLPVTYLHQFPRLYQMYENKYFFREKHLYSQTIEIPWDDDMFFSTNDMRSIITAYLGHRAIFTKHKYKPSTLTNAISGKKERLSEAFERYSDLDFKKNFHKRAKNQVLFKKILDAIEQYCFCEKDVVVDKEIVMREHNLFGYADFSTKDSLFFLVPNTGSPLNISIFAKYGSYLARNKNCFALFFGVDRYFSLVKYEFSKFPFEKKIYWKYDRYVTEIDDNGKEIGEYKLIDIAKELNVPPKIIYDSANSFNNKVQSRNFIFNDLIDLDDEKDEDFLEALDEIRRGISKD